MEFSLFKGEPVLSDGILELVSELPFSIREEANRLLQQYFLQDDAVMQKALKSVSAPYREQGSISKDIAWKYLLTCWINHPNVIKAIREELNKEYSFNFGNGMNCGLLFKDKNYLLICFKL